jgi:hypothetical protein
MFFGSYTQAMEIVKDVINAREKQAENAMREQDDRKARRLISGIVELYDLLTVFQKAIEEGQKEFEEYHKNNITFEMEGY